MYQTIGEKSNKLSPSRWTERIFSVPIRGAHLIFCSRKKDPNELAHHKLHVQSISLWPNVPMEQAGKGLTELEMKFVIGIRGTELEVTEADRRRVKGEPAPPPLEEPKKGTFSAEDYWRVKFADFDTLKKVVLYIRRIEDDEEGSTNVILNGSLEELEKAIQRDLKAICMQFIVKKENNKTLLKWSDRVLTVGVAPHTLYLSQKNRPDRIAYHKMLVKEIHLWPNTGLQYLESLTSSDTETRLSVILQGTVVPGEEEEALVQSVANSTTNESILSEGTATTTTTTVSYSEGKEEKWKIRFSNFGELYKTVQTLRGTEASSAVVLDGDLSVLLKHLKLSLRGENADRSGALLDGVAV